VRFLGTTRGRLALVSAAALAIALVVADIAIYAVLGYLEGRDFDLALQQQAAVLDGDLAISNGQLTYDGGDLPDAGPNGTAVATAVVGPFGVMGSSRAEPFTTATLMELAAPSVRLGRTIWLLLDDRYGRPERVYISPTTIDGQRAVLVVSRSPVEAETSRLRSMVLVGLLSVLIVVLGFGLAYWLAGRVLRPVGKIAGLAESLSQWDLHRRVEVTATHDEIGQLVDTFNRMLGRLELSFQSLADFTADASHELRAPLALVRTELELALKGDHSGAEYRRTLGVIRSQVEHLTQVVDRLLLLAQADAGSLVLDRTPVDLVDLLHETASRWELRAAASEVLLEVATPDTGVVEADLLLLRRVLDNLVDNAIKHSPAGSAVTLTAALRDGRWCIEVRDRGPGIPAEQRERVFRRFATVDSARTRKESVGAGLGLALCAAIAAAHEGRILIASHPGPGCLIRLELPTGQDARPASPGPATGLGRPEQAERGSLRPDRVLARRLNWKGGAKHQS